MNRIKKFIEEAGWPRILIGVFLVILFIVAPFVGVPVDAAFSDTLVRFGMNGVLVLAIHGPGHRKTPQQRMCEKLKKYTDKLKEYCDFPQLQGSPEN